VADKMTKSTALGRLFKYYGVLNWDGVFPEQICAKCLLRAQCPGDKHCTALTVIISLADQAAISPAKAAIFIFDIKEALKLVE